MTTGVCNDTEAEQQTVRKNRPSVEQFEMAKSVLEVMKESGALQKIAGETIDRLSNS